MSEIRHAFSKNGGNLGESGSVRFMFHKKGLIAVEKSAATEEQLMDIVLEHGGEDLNDEGDTWEIITDPAGYEAVAAAVKAAGIPTVMSEVTMVASTYTKLEGTAANQMMRLLEVLEDCDDTQNVYSNFDMDAETDGTGGELIDSQASKDQAARLWRPFYGNHSSLRLRKGKKIETSSKIFRAFSDGWESDVGRVAGFGGNVGDRSREWQ